MEESKSRNSIFSVRVEEKGQFSIGEQQLHGSSATSWWDYVFVCWGVVNKRMRILRASMKAYSDFDQSLREKDRG